MSLDIDKVSVIIASYNRFSFLLNTIRSIKEQTYRNLEIIVINDCSTEKEYYEYDWNVNGVKIIHLQENSKSVCGFSCPGGYQRNFGIKIATGKYIAFCDDDDTWFPKKIELQINAMKETGCKMSSTDGLIGNGPYDCTREYPKYNAEYYYNQLQDIYRNKGSTYLINGFPRIWTLDFTKLHNCFICSSVVIEKDIIDKVGEFARMKHGDDYEYWLRALQYTDSVYCNATCVFYDYRFGKI